MAGAARVNDQPCVRAAPEQITRTARVIEMDVREEHVTHGLRPEPERADRVEDAGRRRVGPRVDHADLVTVDDEMDRGEVRTLVPCVDCVNAVAEVEHGAIARQERW